MKRVIRAVFDDPNNVDPELLVKSKELKDLLKTQVVETIILALNHNKLYACVFEINDSNSYIEIHKNHWIQALETCLLWYVEDENYEMCTKIKDLVYQIQNKKKSNLYLTKDESDGK